MWPAAREPVSEEQRPLINIASEAMADESQKIGVTLAGFAALSENHAAFTWYLHARCLCFCQVGWLRSKRLFHCRARRSLREPPTAFKAILLCLALEPVICCHPCWGSNFCA